MLTAAALMMQAGCGIIRSSPDKVQDLDYTVVEDEDVPKELAEMIDARKNEQMHLTYATNEYMYIVAGYGEQQAGGYSIRLDSIYLGENAIYIKTSLIGPQKKENISKAKTYPYIVVKIENRSEPVIFE